MNRATLHILLFLAGTLSLVGAFIDIWAAPEHLDEWWGYGAFFLAAAAVQALYACALVRWPRPWLVRVGIVGNLALIALWVWTRTIGIPFVGPGAGEVEPVGVVDVVAKVVEGGLIVLLIALLWQLGRRWRIAAATLRARGEDALAIHRPEPLA